MPAPDLFSRRTFVSLLFMTAGCSSGTKKAETVPEKKYQLRGEVMRLDSQQQIATIKHENIDGWMEAMTMDFPIKDKAEFAKLAPGKKIKATVIVQEIDYWLTDIQPE